MDTGQRERAVLQRVSTRLGGRLSFSLFQFLPSRRFISHLRFEPAFLREEREHATEGGQDCHRGSRGVRAACNTVGGSCRGESRGAVGTALGAQRVETVRDRNLTTRKCPLRYELAVRVSASRRGNCGGATRGLNCRAQRDEALHARGHRGCGESGGRGSRGGHATRVYRAPNTRGVLGACGVRGDSGASRTCGRGGHSLETANEIVHQNCLINLVQTTRCTSVPNTRGVRGARRVRG